MALPNEIAGLEWWVKADSLGLANAAVVSSWTDSGPNAFTSTQTTSTKKPKQYTNVLNGLPVVRFSGAQGLLSQASSTLAATTQFFVHRPTSLTTTGTLRGTGAAGGNHGLQVRVNGGLLNLVDSYNVDYGSENTALSTTQFNVSTFSATAGGTAQFYRNGTADGSIPISTGYTTGGPYPSPIGAHDASVSDEFFTGDIAEIISYNRVLTTAERAQVHTYLQNKYAITVADYVPAPSGPPPGQFFPFFT